MDYLAGFSDQQYCVNFWVKPRALLYTTVPFYAIRIAKKVFMASIPALEEYVDQVLARLRDADQTGEERAEENDRAQADEHDRQLKIDNKDISSQPTGMQ